MKINTKCVHGSNKRFDNTGAVSVPIFQSATFIHPGVEQSTGYDYSRLQNPTREYLEDIVANLEEGAEALAFSTGMAAITALMELFSPGDHIIASDDLYGGSVRLFRHISAKNGVRVTLLDTGDIHALEGAIRPETKAVFVETPTNPMMQVTDIAAVAQITRANGLLLVVDNTFLTPYLQRPLTLGADIVIHSGTKYLGGHNDTLAGFLVVNDAELIQRLRFIYTSTGACLSPFDSWLIIRGIKTLALRMRQHEKSANVIAHWLRKQPKVRAVYYCGFEDHPGHAVNNKQADGFGAVISFEVDNAKTARDMLERIKLVHFAESLGGVESLMTYPYMQTHADVPEEQRLSKGITDKLLRLSVGIEDVNDIIADLSSALEE
ncbi:MAG: PLP-dependent aspartate aminotransferase family protein [Oscillospiraceae bacterium]|nr:PLP-dependent aspartate aminotransferase family protein [Oscillospiraceae bacterium]